MLSFATSKKKILQVEHGTICNKSHTRDALGPDLPLTAVPVLDVALSPP